MKKLSLQPAVVAVSVTMLIAGSTGVAQAKEFVTPPAASKFAASFKVDTAGYFTANAALDAAGTAHLAWEAPGGASLVSCTLPRGARKCSDLVSLPLVHSDNNAYGRTLVLQPSPGEVEVVANECCQAEPQLPISVWISRDGGHTFAPPISVGSAPGFDDAVAVGGQLVLFSHELDGLHEQVTPADGSAPATAETLVSPDGGAVDATVMSGGSMLIAHESQLFSPTVADTTSVDLQPSATATPSTVASFAGEDLLSIATGGGATYLMTRVIDKSGTLDPPVRVRHWNGAGFDAPHVLPVPGTGDDSLFSLAVDGSGRLHVVWLGAREDYRLWHSVSNDGGRTWHALLLGDAFHAASVYPVLDSAGTGIALELTAGTGPAVIQPLLITPTVSLSVGAHRTVFTAHVGPAVAGRVVSLQRLRGKRWTTVANARESRTGAVTFTGITLRAGKNSYRAYVSGQYGTYDVGASRVVTVKG